jgi:hypothetical protein
MVRAQLIDTWEAGGLKRPRVTIAFRDPEPVTEVICILYDVERQEVTEAYRFGKFRRAARKQQHLKEVAVAALAAYALGARPMFEIDL